MAASAKKKLARNLTLSLQRLAHVQGASSAIWQLQQKRRSQSDTASHQSLAHVIEVVAIAGSRCRSRCLLYGSFSKKDARSQSDNVVAVAGSRRRHCLLYGSFSKKDARNLTLLSLQSLAHVKGVVCYMAASAKKTLARNLSLSLQLLAHIEGVVCYMAASATTTLVICHCCHCSPWLTSSKPLSAIWQLKQKRRSQSDAIVTVVCWQ
jgi:hypothetical protein